MHIACWVLKARKQSKKHEYKQFKIIYMHKLRDGV